MGIDLGQIQSMMDQSAQQAMQLQMMTMQYNDKVKTVEGLSNAEKGGTNLEGTISGNMK
jgi:hypothetical protein